MRMRFACSSLLALSIAGVFAQSSANSFEVASIKPSDPDSPEPAEQSGPSVFAAIQEQSGLKLESQKEPADFIAIESIEKPSEN